VGSTPIHLRHLKVASHRIARDSHLAQYGTDPATLQQHLVTNDMYLIHPEHPPPSEVLTSSGLRRDLLPAGGSVSERRKGQFLSGAIRGSRFRSEFQSVNGQHGISGRDRLTGALFSPPKRGGCDQGAVNRGVPNHPAEDFGSEGWGFESLRRALFHRQVNHFDTRADGCLLSSRQPSYAERTRE
jgi:hypothetical protein